MTDHEARILILQYDSAAEAVCAAYGKGYAAGQVDAKYDINEMAELKTELKETLSAMIAQGCACENGVYDSMAMTTYAVAMMRLIGLGVMEQVGESVGRRVFARFV